MGLIKIYVYTLLYVFPLYFLHSYRILFRKQTLKNKGKLPQALVAFLTLYMPVQIYYACMYIYVYKINFAFTFACIKKLIKNIGVVV